MKTGADLVIEMLERGDASHAGLIDAIDAELAALKQELQALREQKAVGRFIWDKIGECYTSLTDIDIDDGSSILLYAAPIPAREAPNYAWESTTEAYTRFVTDAQYQKFTANVQKWYRPICPVPVSEWISVKDRLPEIGKEVWAFRPLANESNDPFILSTHLTSVTRKSPQDVEHSFSCWCHPTHWMPIPAAPKEQA